MLSTDHAYYNEVVDDPGGTLGPRVLTRLQLVMIHRGSCTIAHNDRELRLAEGQAALLWPGEREYLRASREVPTHRSWCKVEVAFASSSLREGLRTRSGPLILTHRLEALMRVGLSLKNESGETAERLRNSVAASLLLEYALKVQPDRDQISPPAVERVKRYVALHFAEPVSLSDLVTASQVSRSHLNRLFRAHLGTTPIRYLWQVRVSEGVRLLRDTELPILGVAERTGFATPTHFARMIRATHRRPPSALRRSHLYEGGLRLTP